MGSQGSKIPCAFDDGLYISKLDAEVPLHRVHRVSEGVLSIRLKPAGRARQAQDNGLADFVAASHSRELTHGTAATHRPLPQQGRYRAPDARLHCRPHPGTALHLQSAFRSMETGGLGDREIGRYFWTAPWRSRPPKSRRHARVYDARAGQWHAPSVRLYAHY